MGTIGAIGAKPIGLFGGMLGEGAVVGVLGGLLGVPGGFLLGTYLVDRFGQSMLAGSGGTIAAHFTPSLIVIGAAAGIVSGTLAMIGPAVRLAREGPLASMASAGGVQRARRIPMWPLVAGAGMLAAAVVVLKIFERGSLPLNMGINGMTVAMFGVASVTVWIAPRGAGLFVGLLTVARPDVGRLLRADVQRYALMFGLSAAILAAETSLAIGSQSMQLLGTEQVAAQKADRLPAALLIAGQSVLDQRDGQLADSTFKLVTEAADGRNVSSRWRSTISSGTLSRLVIGVTPGDWYSQALYEPTGVHDTLWQGLRDRGDRPEPGCRQPTRSRRGRNGRAADGRGAEALPGGRDISSTDDQRHRGRRYRPGVGEVGALRLGGRTRPGRGGLSLPRRCDRPP